MAIITTTTNEQLRPDRDADVINSREETEFWHCLVHPLQERELLQHAIIHAINEMGKTDLPILEEIVKILADGKDDISA